jgi:hypothetical protein
MCAARHILCSSHDFGAAAFLCQEVLAARSLPEQAHCRSRCSAQRSSTAPMCAAMAWGTSARGALGSGLRACWCSTELAHKTRPQRGARACQCHRCCLHGDAIVQLPGRQALIAQQQAGHTVVLAIMLQLCTRANTLRRETPPTRGARQDANAPGRVCAGAKVCFAWPCLRRCARWST